MDDAPSSDEPDTGAAQSGPDTASSPTEEATPRQVGPLPARAELLSPPADRLTQPVVPLPVLASSPEVVGDTDLEVREHVDPRRGSGGLGEVPMAAIQRADITPLTVASENLETSPVAREARRAEEESAHQSPPVVGVKPGDAQTATASATPIEVDVQPIESPDRTAQSVQEAPTAYRAIVDVVPGGGQPSRPAPLAGTTSSVGVLPREALSFGPRAALGPTPRSSVRAECWWHGTPDIEIDWVDAKEVSLRAASCRGHLHRYEGELRQDSFAMVVRNGVALLAVADGVGSAPHSHIGSRVAVDAAVRLGLGEYLQSHLIGAGPSEVTTTKDLSEIADQIVSAAAHMGWEPKDLSSTLAVAALGLAPMESREGEISYRAVLCQLGDSGFGRIRNGQAAVLNCPSPEGDSEILETATEALPGNRLAQVWVESLSPGDALLVMSDGVINPVRANPDFREGLADIWCTDAPTPSTLLAVLDATVKTFDDDRTLVGVRLGGDHARR